MQLKINESLFPEITMQHIEIMCHAIGLDDEKPKRSRRGEYYYPYRNYYDSGTKHLAWEQLVELGYACKSDGSVYHLTNLGLSALSELIDVQIYSSAARYEAVTIRAVFKEMCRSDVFVGYGCWIPTSCIECATRTRIPLHKVRKAMHVLVSEGYVHKTYYSEFNEYSCRPICIWGYSCTEKARKTKIYKKFYEEEMRRINEILQKD